MRWRVGLIDSCGAAPQAIGAVRFTDAGGRVECTATVADADASGHGSRLAALLVRERPGLELLLAQVFGDTRSTTAATVAAAIDWCLSEGCSLLHLSLGLADDRAVLAAAVARAVGKGLPVVASTPARGAPAYPAAYPGVIRATGDARCAPGEISWLAPATFGGCPRFEGTASGATGLAGVAGGASVGAAAVTHALVAADQPLAADAAIAMLESQARYRGPERRTI
jgi:hypothetical protein